MLHCTFCLWCCIVTIARNAELHFLPVKIWLLPVLIGTSFLSTCGRSLPSVLLHAAPCLWCCIVPCACGAELYRLPVLVGAYCLSCILLPAFCLSSGAFIVLSICSHLLPSVCAAFCLSNCSRSLPSACLIAVGHCLLLGCAMRYGTLKPCGKA